MRQVFGEWGVVTETKSASYGILSAPVANNITLMEHVWLLITLWMMIQESILQL